MDWKKENRLRSRIGQFLLPGTILICFTIIFCWKIIFREGVFFGLDMVFFYPSKAFLLEEIKSGVIPLWNPYVFCGTPTASNTITWGIFYPLNLLFLLLPLDIAFNIMVILHIFLAGISMYILMRSLEVENFPSLISAVTFMFSGYIITIISAGMIDLFSAMVWIPLLLMFFRKALNTGSVIYCVGGGIVFGFQALAGHPQITILTSYVLFSYFLFHLFSSNGKIYLKERFKMSVKTGILTSVIGFGIFAIQFFPALEYFSRFSLRGEGVTYDFASSYSLNPKHLVTYLLPDIFNNPIKGYYWGAMNFDELGTYMGILSLILAGYAVFLSRHRERFYFTVLGLVSLFLAFGRYGFIYKVGYEFLPGFNLFRCPARWLIFTTFSLSVLAGFGASELSMRKDIKKVMSRLAICLAVWCVALGIFLAIELFLRTGLINRLVMFITVSEWGKQLPLPVRQSDVELSLLKNVLICGSISLVLAVSLLMRFSKSVIKICMVILIFFDLWLFGEKFVFTIDPDAYLANGIWSIIKGKGEFYRVVTVSPIDNFGAAGNKVFCFESEMGNLIMMRDFRDFMDKVPQWTDLMGGKYILTTMPIEANGYRYLGEKIVEVIEPYHLDHVYRDKIRVRLYEKTNVIPMVFAVHQARVVNSHDEVLSEMTKTSFDPRREILLEEPIPENTEEISSIVYDDKVAIMKYTSNRIVVNVDFKNKGFLVMGEVFYPGWKVFINKKPARLYRANYLMRAIYLEKGRQEVVLSYEPVSFKIGAGMTLLTIGCIVGFYVNRYAVQPLKRNV